MKFKLNSPYVIGGVEREAGTCWETDNDDAMKTLIADGVATEITKENVQQIAKEQNPNGSGNAISVRPVEEEKLDVPQLVKETIDEYIKQDKAHRPFVATNDDGSEYMKTGGYDHFGQFLQDVAHTAQEKRPSEHFDKWLGHLQKASGMSEGVSADGGFLVPTEFRNQLLMDSLGPQSLRPRCTTIPMQTNSIRIPIVNESSRASNTYGGVTMYRPAEGGTKTSSLPELGQIELNLHKIIGLCYVTDELLEDSPISLQPLLTRMFTESIGWQVDSDILNGTGAGQSLGILNAPCLVSVAKETGQAATTIETKNITKMWSRLKPRSMGNAVWVANGDTFPQLAELSISVGTGGSAAGLIGRDATVSPTGTLMGRPLILSEHCQTLGTVGDIYLGDFRQYLIGQKSGGIQVDTSIHVKFTTDETAFRFVLRIDGQPWEPSALTPEFGSNTLSSFVALATRS